jgi:hypothetical protein
MQISYINIKEKSMNAVGIRPNQQVLDQVPAGFVFVRAPLKADSTPAQLRPANPVATEVVPALVDALMLRSTNAGERGSPEFMAKREFLIQVLTDNFFGKNILNLSPALSKAETKPVINLGLFQKANDIDSVSKPVPRSSPAPEAFIALNELRERAAKGEITMMAPAVLTPKTALNELRETTDKGSNKTMAPVVLTPNTRPVMLLPSVSDDKKLSPQHNWTTQNAHGLASRTEPVRVGLSQNVFLQNPVEQKSADSNVRSSPVPSRGEQTATNNAASVPTPQMALQNWAQKAKEDSAKLVARADTDQSAHLYLYGHTMKDHQRGITHTHH